VYAPLVTMTVVRRPWVPHDVAYVARSTGDASRLTTPVRNAIAALDPALPLYRLTPVSTLQARSTARTTFTLFLLGVAAVVATVIGALGIYGVISYLVSLRTREIGVRIALGAQSADVRRLVAGQALVDALVGVGLGLAGAVVVTRALSALLFGVRPTDPATLAAASVLLLGTALLASWLPARRAAMLDPAKALREE
jgi:putative ABC transport system permease protein